MLLFCRRIPIWGYISVCEPFLSDSISSLLFFRSNTNNINNHKKPIEQPSGSQEADFGILSTHSHATHVAAGPQEAEGSSPAGQVSKSSQGLTTTSWLHLPCSLLRLDGFHMGQLHLRHFLRLAQNALTHYLIFKNVNICIVDQLT